MLQAIPNVREAVKALLQVLIPHPIDDVIADLRQEKLSFFIPENHCDVIYVVAMTGVTGTFFGNFGER